MGERKRKNLIKKPTVDTKVKIGRVDEDDYPVICFKYLQLDVSLKCCDDSVFRSFIERCCKLAKLGWKEIRVSHRHSYGGEKIPLSSLKVNKFPEIITPDVTSLWAFRYSGDNLPFLALVEDKILRVIYIEARFGDLYDH